MVSEENYNGPKAFCINADADRKIRSHSIPCNEPSGLLHGCRAFTVFIASHPIYLINSIEWRHGNPEFTDSTFPDEEILIFAVSERKNDTLQAASDSQMQLFWSAPAPCQGCVIADVRQIHVSNILVGKSTTRDTSLTDLLFHLPTVPEIQYSG